MKPLKAVKVIRWISDTITKTYVFDTDVKQKYDDNIIVINEYIYQDDNIEYAINKIAYHISKIEDNITAPFYCWVNKQNLLFDIESIKWSGYHINPFKSRDRDSEELKEPITYNYKQGLFSRNYINIVFYSDFKQKNKYYFTDYKTAFTNFLKRDGILSTLYNKNVIHTKIQSEIYHRIDFYDKIKYDVDISNLFDVLHTNKDIPLIQLINDNSKILYKLYKKHTLKEKFLLNIFNQDKNRQESTINLYSIMTNGTYCKITISKSMITLSYILDLRSSVNWNNLINNKNMIVKYLKKYLHQNIIPKEFNIKVNIYFNIDNSSFAILSKKIGEYIDIFHVTKLLNEKNKNKIMCVYKRSENYNKEPVDINQYIKSRLNLGISDIELIAELVNLGISENDAKNLIISEIDAIKAIEYNQIADKIKIENTGTFLTIEQYKQGYLVDITNCLSKTELNNIIFWLTRIIEETRRIVKTNAKANLVILPSQIPEPSRKMSEAFSSSKSKSKSKSPKQSTSLSLEDENIGDIDIDLGNDDDFFQGGALGKEKHGYFMNMLKNADKDLFGENYARKKCQAAFQPLVLSNDEKDNLEKQGMLKLFDNIIEHGSKPNIKNFYTCPRIWCPVSKVPLDYNDDNAKCPLENEEPMKLFWNQDKTKPRFVKLTDADENGIAVPCCFKKNIKKVLKVPVKPNKPNKPMEIVDKESSNSTQSKQDVPIPLSPRNAVPVAKIVEKQQEDDKEENYIMNKTAPIPIGRHGLVPETLYKLLLPNTNFVLCSKNLNKTEKCLVRRGIQHKTKNTDKKDSIMYAVSYLLGFKNKKKFIQDIKGKLDIVKFMSLENGNVCKDFLDITPILSEKQNVLCKQFLYHFTNNDTNIFNIKDLNCSKSSYKLSRLLNIYKAYLKFIDYLEADDFPMDKSSYYLYSLLASLYNVLLILWEKQDNEIQIVCPHYISFVDILTSIGLNPNAIMILKEGEFYEPLELKLRNVDGTKLLKLKDHPEIQKVFDECNRLNMKLDNTTYKNLFLFSQLPKTNIYKKSRDFIITSVIINNDLTINKFMTRSHILIHTDKINISILPTIISDLNIKHLYFYDDIVNNKYKISLNISDLDIFVQKCAYFHINYDVGIVYKTTSEDIYSSLVITASTLSNNLIVHYDTYNKYHNYIDSEYKDTKKWFQLQQLVVKTLLKHYNDNKLKHLSEMPRFQMIKTLLEYFKNIPEQNKIQVILEQIPLYSIDSIKHWINDIMLYIKYDYYSRQIKETKTEFLFSQYNIADSIPQKLLLYHKSMPNNNLNNQIIHQYVISDHKFVDVKLPSIFDGTAEKLKSKWTKHKKLIWYYMTLLRRKYKKETIPELFNWLCKELGFNLTYENIEEIKHNKYYAVLNDDDMMRDLLTDPSFYTEYIKYTNKINNTKKKFKTLQMFWDEYYLETDMEERTKIIKYILENDEIYPNDLDLLSISELLNVSFLIIHRTKYGETKNDVRRGELEDLLLSSTLIPAKTNIYNRPLIILGKEYDKHSTCYYAITEKEKIYLQLKDAHNDVKSLVEAHIHAQ
jgi:hypothetical protein